MRRRTAGMLGLVLSGGLTTAGLAATHYVAPGGDDAHPGTERQPWRTLQRAATAVQPGDTVRIRAGEYVADTFRFRKAGTADSPITYRAAGDGEVLITNASVVPRGTWKRLRDRIWQTQISAPVKAVFQKDAPLLQPWPDHHPVTSADTLIPNSFYVDGQTLCVWLEDGGDPNDTVMRVSPGHVIQLVDCHHSVFDGLTVEYGGTGFKDQGHPRTHHVTVRNCIVRSISGQGIQPVPAHAVIERNLFRKIGSSKYLHGIYGSERGTVIRFNVFEQIAGAGIHQYRQSSPAEGECEIYGNVFRTPRKMTTNGLYYVDIVAWGKGGNLIHSNVFYGEGKRSGISLNSPDNRVYNNTFVGSARAIQFYRGRPGNRVCNNIVLDAAGPYLVWPAGALPQTLDYNLYHSAGASPKWERDGVLYTKFGSYQRAAGEAHSRHEYPGLAGPVDARPRPGSPAIDRGTALPEVTVDADGVARPQGAALDLGAYERKAGAGAAVPGGPRPARGDTRFFYLVTAVNRNGESGFSREAAAQ